MDFAKRQLLKYGWEEGKGLGKNENGTNEALKPQYKFDTAGVGCDKSEEFKYDWWNHIYNKTADSITVVSTQNGEVNIEKTSEESLPITTKKPLKHRLKKTMLAYGQFLKTTTLTPSGEECLDESTVTENEELSDVDISQLTDDQLFSACSGRTAHKGARHGITSSAKLARIEEQERILLNKMKAKTHNNKICKKYKKSDKFKKFVIDSLEKSECENSNDEITEEEHKKRTEYYIKKQQKTKTKKSKRKEKKKICEITHMLKNVSVQNEDVYKHCHKSGKIHKCKRKMKKQMKKKLKLISNNLHEEYISKIKENLAFNTEFRKKLEKEQSKTVYKKILTVAKELDEKLCI